MSKKFFTSIDLGGNELQNFVAHKVDSLPGEGKLGQICFLSSDKKYYYYNGTQWTALVPEVAQVTIPKHAKDIEVVTHEDKKQIKISYNEGDPRFIPLTNLQPVPTAESVVNITNGDIDINVGNGLKKESNTLGLKLNPSTNNALQVDGEGLYVPRVTVPEIKNLKYKEITRAIPAEGVTIPSSEHGLAEVVLGVSVYEIGIGDKQVPVVVDYSIDPASKDVVIGALSTQIADGHVVIYGF